MTSIEQFLSLIHTEVGLELAVEDIDRGFDQVAGWDSLHLLTLITALEETTGQQISMPDVLQATKLADIYGLAAIS